MTPGPWKVAPAKGTLCAWRIETQISDRPCVAFVNQTIGSNQEENENAQAIAALPDCIEALKEIQRVTTELLTFQIAEKALKKAGCL